MPDTETRDLVDLTARTVAAYVAHNAVPLADLPVLIAETHKALVALTAPPAATAPSEHKTAAEIRRSVTPDAITSFIDGKPYKTLRRHLNTHALTPEAYRTRFGLPADYPMVAANYSAQRTALAKAIGLGTVAAARAPRVVGGSEAGGSEAA